MTDSMTGRGDEPLLIVGGAGFIGSNLADGELAAGRRVRILDDLSRDGAEHNLRWLRERHGSRLELARADVRDRRAVRDALSGTGAVFHCAAQVAVTTSLDDPPRDFEVNALGTLNLLEELRHRPRPLVFTSTNKVYGDLADVELEIDGDRYRPADPTWRGVDESTPLAFRSPYGCSKGAADQYVLDYARSFGIPATVFRMSCVYGPRQFGTEDQGWVAHFFIRALTGRPITIYGDGRQLRDLLFVDDLVDAFARARTRIDDLAGRAYNLGGGPERSASPREVLDAIGELAGCAPEVRYDAWRPGDQRYYVSDTRAFERATGWRPRAGVREGLERLRDWLAAHLESEPARDVVTGGRGRLAAR